MNERLRVKSNERSGSIFPENVTADQIFMLPQAEVDSIAKRACVTSTKLLELLMNAVERKQENDDRIKVLNEEHNTQEAQKGRERQHPIRQAQELLDISRSADFFEPDTSGTLHDAEKMESEAFAQDRKSVV